LDSVWIPLEKDYPVRRINPKLK